MKRLPEEPSTTAAPLPAKGVTRREVLGAGVALASAAVWAPALGKSLRPAVHPAEVEPVTAFLVDGTIALPKWALALVHQQSTGIPAVHVGLDAESFRELGRLLATHTAVAGISSGATLFCLERIAWDHGFRLTTRQQKPIDGTGKSVSHTAVRVGHYRPSRTDGLLHYWVMRKSGAAQPLSGPREA